MEHSLEFCERLNERLTVIHRRDATPTTLDALLLAAFLPESCGRTCELGAGGGIISLLAAARGRIGSGVLIEREEVLAALAERNIEKNALAATLSARCTDLRDYTDAARFDTVLANPPYRRANEGKPAAHRLTDVARYERAGGILDFCLAAARLLRPEGHFYCVFPTQREGDLRAALAIAGLFPVRTVTVYPYAGARPKLLLQEAILREGNEERERLLLARERGGPPTEAAMALYESGILITEGEEND
jgi:tRNA1(Val) A37 N6-methylase TrmN6